jgi:Mg-chelatase subunit ChlD
VAAVSDPLALFHALGLHWAHPGWLWLLPLVLLALGSRRRATLDDDAPTLLHPDLGPLLRAAARPRAGLGRRLLRVLALAAFLLALAQPQRLGAPAPQPPQGRDLVALIDTSGSMGLHDLQWDGKPASRLAVVKRVFADLALRRRGDRFTVIAFGSRVATVVPPTFDRRATAQMVEHLPDGVLGDNTAIGDAIGLALRRIAHGPRRLRPVMILYSDDWGSNAGKLSLRDAAALAVAAGVRIYTVQVGGGGAELGKQPGLRTLARVTGGRDFLATAPGAQQAATAAIARLNPRLRPPPGPPRIRALQVWPLAAGLLLLLLGSLPAPARRQDDTP